MFRTKEEQDKVKIPYCSKERRGHPRVSVSLPFKFRLLQELKFMPGFVLNASEAGLLIQTFKDMPVGQKLNIKILLKILQKKLIKSILIKGNAMIIWRDIYWWDDWDGYQYGLKFVQIFDEDCRKLRLLLEAWPNLEEVSQKPIENRLDVEI